jgi:transcriptional regulator with XRE-family HTH domain
MSHWIGKINSQVDVEVLEESAIALAQSTIYNAIERTGISKSELARRMECNRSLITRILSGSHNLTVRTMARALAVCGFEVRFQYVPVVWNWTAQERVRTEETLPAFAGSTKAADHEAALVVPAFA